MGGRGMEHAKVGRPGDVRKVAKEYGGSIHGSRVAEEWAGRQWEDVRVLRATFEWPRSPGDW